LAQQLGLILNEVRYRVKTFHPRGPQVPEARQFREVHGIDPGRRGLRRLDLYPDGTLVTDVIWDHAGTLAGRNPQTWA
jgi:hypothetical protein